MTVGCSSISLGHVVWVSPFPISERFSPCNGRSIIVLYFNAVSLDNDQLLVMDFHILVSFANHGHGIRANHIVAIARPIQVVIYFCHIDDAGSSASINAKQAPRMMWGAFEGFERRQAIFFSKFSDPSGLRFLYLFAPWNGDLPSSSWFQGSFNHPLWTNTKRPVSERCGW